MNRRRNSGAVFLALWVVLCGCASAAPSNDSSRLRSIQPVVRPGEMEMIIRLDGPFEYTFAELKDPPRLVIDFTPVQEVDAQAEQEVGNFGVERIRTGQPQPGTVRVVFDFGENKPLYLINRTPEGLSVYFLAGPPPKKQAPPPAPAQPATAARPQPTSSPQQGPAAVPANTLIGFDLVNLTLADQRFQNVFGQRTKASLAFDLTQVLLSFDRLALAFGADYQRLSLEGQSTVTGQPTQVSLAPLNLSLRLILRAGSMWPFASAGLAVCHYRETSSLHNTLGYSAGFGFQGGLFVGSPSFKLLRAKVFIQWTRVISSENGIEVNLGGLAVGAGLALAFRLF
jgi:hypothetical protein